MTIAFIREAAIAVQRLPCNQSTQQPVPAKRPLTAITTNVPDSSWKQINHIGGGLFICGAAALEDTSTLDKLGVRSILNCAQKDLYSRVGSCPDGHPLREKLKKYRVEVLDAEDIENQSMDHLWEKAADFIDESLEHGGVAVHCAVGISRSSSTCIAYLMIRENLSLEAAFRRVFRARDCIRPNVGFWQQLCDLEKRTGNTHQIWNAEPAGDEASEVFAKLHREVAQKRAAAKAGWL
eukprot:TRINITY_DN25858_c0_g1_i1.p1 TRINITY_DN25858_c0_g1~~TRINITY_DN25858_c0_g1_i1.p1  ORF type:complete len:264 (-),score=50.55 TRINITY_DN25858_c0_g1_i1:595-1305(-)